MNQHEMRRIALQALYLANQEPELNYNDIVGRTTKALDLKAFPELSGSLLKGILVLLKAFNLVHFISFGVCGNFYAKGGEVVK